jgi:hypothetical protein
VLERMEGYEIKIGMKERKGESDDENTKGIISQ